MQNELKPCPFCGGKVKVSEREGYSGGEYITEIECNVCHMHVENLYNNDKTIDLWNTRQPAFDWKPIEELTLKVLKENKEILLYDDSSYIGYVCNNKEYLKAESIEFPVHYKNIKNYATHYALLTPPQINQSNN